MLARYFRIVSLVPIALSVACGSSDDSSTFDAGSGATPDATTPIDATMHDGAPKPTPDGGTFQLPDATTTCESQILCGAQSTCCAVGQECYQDACVAACASGVHCGGACCPSDDVCLSAMCVVPGAACMDSFGCDENQFCEPTIGKCLPQPSGTNLCISEPPTPAFTPVIEWQWTDSTIHAGYNQVINTPSVADLDGDGVPEVVIVTSTAYDQTGVAYLRALNGRDGTEKWPSTADVYNATYAVGPRDTSAIADIDHDGKLDIVAFGQHGGLIAFNADGSFKWQSTKHDGTTAYTGNFLSSAVAIADMDNDGQGEIVAGGVVLDSTGKLVSDSFVGRELWGANDTSYGAVSIVADVDGNASTLTQYVVTGNRAYQKDGTVLWDKSATLHDGYPAIADLDNDGVPELVVTYSTGGTGYIRVQNATTGAILGSPLQVPGSGRGGPPTIANFDGDPQMEFASANGNKYSVFEWDASTQTITVKWSHDTQDLSSNVTGSSVFDFEGDGAAEVIYNDECYSRVFRGTDGTVLLEIPSSTATIHEYPIVVDVKGDNHSAYVVVANDVNHLNGTTKCPATDAGAYVPRHGVFVYGDPNNKWVRTRRVWNEHAYHITNINADGTLPHPEDISWGPNGLDNYRVSSQGKGVFNAPDLAVDLAISTAPCPTGLQLRALVQNKGSLGIAAGVKVDFYLGTSTSGTLLGESMTTQALLPGQSQVVTYDFTFGNQSGPIAFFVTVDGGASGSAVPECNENNNSAGAGSAVCPSLR